MRATWTSLSCCSGYHGNLCGFIHLRLKDSNRCQSYFFPFSFPAHCKYRHCYLDVTIMTKFMNNWEQNYKKLIQHPFPLAKLLFGTNNQMSHSAIVYHDMVHNLKFCSQFFVRLLGSGRVTFISKTVEALSSGRVINNISQIIQFDFLNKIMSPIHLYLYFTLWCFQLKTNIGIVTQSSADRKENVVINQQYTCIFTVLFMAKCNYPTIYPSPIPGNFQTSRSCQLLLAPLTHNRMFLFPCCVCVFLFYMF